MQWFSSVINPYRTGLLAVQTFHKYKTIMGQHSKPPATGPVTSEMFRQLLKEKGILHNGKHPPIPTFLRCVAAIKVKMSLYFPWNSKMLQFQHLICSCCIGNADDADIYTAAKTSAQAAAVLSTCVFFLFFLFSIKKSNQPQFSSYT